MDDFSFIHVIIHFISWLQPPSYPPPYTTSPMLPSLRRRRLLWEPTLAYDCRTLQLRNKHQTLVLLHVFAAKYIAVPSSALCITTEFTYLFHLLSLHKFSALGSKRIVQLQGILCSKQDLPTKR